MPCSSGVGWCVVTGGQGWRSAVRAAAGRACGFLRRVAEAERERSRCPGAPEVLRGHRAAGTAVGPAPGERGLAGCRTLCLFTSPQKALARGGPAAAALCKRPRGWDGAGLGTRRAASRAAAGRCAGCAGRQPTAAGRGQSVSPRQTGGVQLADTLHHRSAPLGVCALIRSALCLRFELKGTL